MLVKQAGGGVGMRRTVAASLTLPPDKQAGGGFAVRCVVAANSRRSDTPPAENVPEIDLRGAALGRLSHESGQYPLWEGLWDKY